MKKFTFLIVALLVAAMGFAQTKVLDPAQNKGKQKVAVQSQKYISGNHTQTRNTRALECADDALFSTVDLDACQSAGTSNTSAGYLHAMRVDGFTLPLASIRFFGAQMLYSGGWTEAADVETLNFNIKIYEDDNNMPGTVVETVSGVALTHTATTDMLFGSYSIFQFDYAFETPVDVPSTFWIEVSNSDASAWFMWLDNESGDFTSAAYNMEDDEWDVSTDAAYQICLIPQAPANATIVAMPTSLSFNGVIGNEIAAKNVTIAAYNLTTAITATTSAPFAISNDGATYAETAEISENGGTLYVKYTPTAEGTHNGTVVLSATGAENVNIALTGSAIDCTTPIDEFPYEEGFENGIPVCWTLIDADGDGYNWMSMSENSTLSGYAGQLSYDGTNCAMSESYLNSDYQALNANNWMITQAITLPADGVYMASWYATSIDGEYPDSYSVYIGTEPTVANLTANEAVLTHTADEGEWTLKQIILAEYAGQTIYIGFNHVDYNNFVIAIDNFSIVELLAQDITITNVNFTNASGCGITSNNVIATVRNDGFEPIASFELAYSVNEGTPVVVTVTPDEAIAAGETYEYTFEEAITINADGDYDVVVTATLTGDTNTEGNEAEASFSRLAPETLPYTLVIDDEDALTGWTIIDANDDDTTWEYSDGDGIEYSYNADNAANDWAISSCITMPAGTYKFSFSHTSSSSFPESLKVFYGNAPTIEAMTNMIEDYPSLTGYAVDSKNFTIEADGTYYIGFYCYSEADMNYLDIDSIHIEAIPPYEASVSNLTFGTESGCGIESSTISATITNNGTAPLTTFTAAYKVDDNAPVSQDFTLENALALDSSYVFTFETPMAIDAAGEYDVMVYITLDGDENHTNDTINGIIEKMVPEIELTSIVPADGASLPYAESMNISGTITNNSCTLTSYVVTYKVNDGEFVADYTVECNVAEDGTHTFTHNVPFEPEAAGEYTITVKVSMPNGTADDTDDNEMTSTFTLINCDPITIGYTQDFETDLTVCWGTISNNTANDVASGKMGLYDLNGNKVFRFSSFSSATDYNQYLITPEISLTEDAVLSFKYAKSNTSDETFRVMASTTDNNIASFTAISEDITASSTDFTTFRATIPANTKYVAINYFSNFKYYLYVDDLALTAVPTTADIVLTSVAPATGTNVMAENDITISGVVTNNGAALTSYKVAYTVDNGEAVEYEVSEINVALGETHNFTHPTAISGLAAGSHTIVVTVSDPNGTEDIDDSNNSQTITVNVISCDPITTFPYEEGFENGIPACWTLIDADGDGYNWMGVSENPIFGTNAAEYAHGGTNAVMSESYRNYVGEFNADNWMITSAIVLPASGEYLATWYALNFDDTDQDTYTVHVGTEPTVAGMTANSAVLSHTPNTEWEMRTVSLAAYAGQTIYIGFHHVNSNMYVIMIDDFSVALNTSAEENIADAIAVYPNPTSDMVTIANAEGKDIVVINSLGQIVASIENAAANQTIDVSNFANGTYFVKVDAEVVKLNVVK